MTKSAPITGIAGQDGSYLTELHVGKGYEVFGLLGPGPGAFHEQAAGLGDMDAGRLTSEGAVSEDDE